MRCFPQLLTGATGQFPIQKKRNFRTVVNETSDGRQIKWADAGAGFIEWRLNFEGISDEERGAIEAFFVSMEGRLNPFTFLDPTANLLEWSEDLSQPAWEKSVWLEVSNNVPDPVGGQSGMRVSNRGAAPGQVQQRLAAPGNYVYSFAFYARSDAPESLRVFRASGATSSESTVRVADVWRRIVSSGSIDVAGDEIRFGVEIPAGTTVCIFGMQAEAQAGASLYKKSAGKAGVYSEARFAEDRLEFTATGPGQHSGVVGIRARG